MTMESKLRIAAAGLYFLQFQRINSVLVRSV